MNERDEVVTGREHGKERSDTVKPERARTDVFVDFRELLPLTNTKTSSQPMLQHLTVIDTYTHSPGWEQFPFLSLQPSRQMAVTDRNTKISLSADSIITDLQPL